MTQRATFNQADVTRAVKACRAAGITVGTVKIKPSGEIVVYASRDAGAPHVNPLDEHLSNGP